MIMFIDLDLQIYDDVPVFAFYDDTNGTFIKFAGLSVWDNLSDFTASFIQVEAVDYERYSRMIPEKFRL